MIAEPMQVMISRADQQRLQRIIHALRASMPGGGHWRLPLNALEQRIMHSETVDDAAIPPAVVTMNSTVSLREIGNEGRSDVLTLVFDADPFGGSVSVLTPLGIALLGARVGDVVEWSTRRGLRRAVIERIVFQPEAAGEVDQ